MLEELGEGERMEDLLGLLIQAARPAQAATTGSVMALATEPIIQLAMEPMAIVAAAVGVVSAAPAHGSMAGLDRPTRLRWLRYGALVLAAAAGPVAGLMQAAAAMAATADGLAAAVALAATAARLAVPVAVEVREWSC
jgi:hypothetical protein